jgi:hypothetical protein
MSTSVAGTAADGGRTGVADLERRSTAGTISICTVERNGPGRFSAFSIHIW